MLYLSQMMGKPVVDATGEKIGTISDLAISTGEVFPRITSLAFQGPGKVPFMISWRKYVDEFDDDGEIITESAEEEPMVSHEEGEEGPLFEESPIFLEDAPTEEGSDEAPMDLD